MSKSIWREGSESTPDKPTLICLGRYGVLGRVTLQPLGSYWFDCCAVGGEKRRSASGYTQTLELAKQIVELIVSEDAVDVEEKVNQVERVLDHLDPFPDYGDLMTLEDFTDNCMSGGFIDYDGLGIYATKYGMSRKHKAVPSEIKAGKIDKSWTHVMWFNR